MIRLPSRRERSGPGGSPGLQNQWRGARRGAVGSTPTRSRHGGRHVVGSPASPERRAAARRDAAAARSEARDPRRSRRRRARSSPTSAPASRPASRPGRSTTWPTRSSAGSTDFAGPPSAVTAHQRDRRRSSTRTSVARRGRRVAIEAASRRRPATCCSRSTARPAVAAPRFRRAEEHLIALTGAEDALVTNNNAAALALAVGLAGRGGVVGLARRAGRDRRRRPDPGDHPAGRGEADRGRDDQPDARRRLRGAARRRAGEGGPPRPSVELHDDRLHRRRPTRPRSRAIAHRHGAIVIDDLGSGALLADRALRAGPRADARASGWRPVRTSSRSAATSWSAGRRRAWSSVGRTSSPRMRRDPLARAMRPDKVTLLGVAATLGLYRAGLAVSRHPRLADDRDARPTTLRTRAERGRRRGSAMAAAVVPLAVDDRRREPARRDDPVVRGRGRRVGRRIGSLAAIRRRGRSPVIGRIEDGRVVLDLRTVDPRRDDELAAKVRAALARTALTGMTVVVGTAGHIDHGKTTLLRALTGIDADRLPEERRRGMTIDVGYAHLALPDGTEHRLRRRPGPRPAGRQHARRCRRDRRRDAGRGRRRRAARADRRAPGAARRARRSGTASRSSPRPTWRATSGRPRSSGVVGRLLDGTSLAGVAGPRGLGGGRSRDRRRSWRR